MMFGYADDWVWWRAGSMSVAMTHVLGPADLGRLLPDHRRHPAARLWTWDRERRCDDARRILGERLAHGETGTGAYRQLRDQLSPWGRPAPCRAAAVARAAVALGTVRA